MARGGRSQTTRKKSFKTNKPQGLNVKLARAILGSELGDLPDRIRDNMKKTTLKEVDIAKMMNQLNSFMTTSRKMFAAVDQGKIGKKLPKGLRALCKGDCNLNKPGVKDDLALAGLGGIMTTVLGLSGQQIEAIGAALKNDGSLTAEQEQVLGTVFDTMGDAFEARMRSGAQAGGMPAPRRSARNQPPPPPSDAAYGAPPYGAPPYGAPHHEDAPHLEAGPPRSPQYPPPDADTARPASAPAAQQHVPPASQAGEQITMTPQQLQDAIDRGVRESLRQHEAQRQQPRARADQGPTLATVREVEDAQSSQAKRYWWRNEPGHECSSFQIAAATTSLALLAGGIAYFVHSRAPTETMSLWEDSQSLMDRWIKASVNSADATIQHSNLEIWKAFMVPLAGIVAWLGVDNFGIRLLVPPGTPLPPETLTTIVVRNMMRRFCTMFPDGSGTTSGLAKLGGGLVTVGSAIVGAGMAGVRATGRGMGAEMRDIGSTTRQTLRSARSLAGTAARMGYSAAAFAPRQLARAWKWWTTDDEFYDEEEVDPELQREFDRLFLLLSIHRDRAGRAGAALAANAANVRRLEDEVNTIRSWGRVSDAEARARATLRRFDESQQSPPPVASARSSARSSSARSSSARSSSARSSSGSTASLHSARSSLGSGEEWEASPVASARSSRSSVGTASPSSVASSPERPVASRPTRSASTTRRTTTPHSRGGSTRRKHRRAARRTRHRGGRARRHRTRRHR